jgi:hypothetical protein
VDHFWFVDDAEVDGDKPVSTERIAQYTEKDAFLQLLQRGRQQFLFQQVLRGSRASRESGELENH